MRLRLLVASSLATCVLWFTSCGDSGPTTTQSTTSVAPAPPPMPTIETFSLNADDGIFRFSSPLTTLSDGESFEIDFRPTTINDGPSGFSNVVEFWLDRGTSEDGIALGFAWFPDSEWGVYFFRPGDGFVNLPILRLINLGGRFRTVRIRRANGVSEWLLDGESLLVLDDTNAQRTVYARVVGTAADFRYDTSAVSVTQSRRQSSAIGEELCGTCRAR